MNKLFALAGLITFAAASHAQVMTFQPLEVIDAATHDQGITYSEGGLVLTKGVGEPFNFKTFGTLEARYPGSTAMFNDTIGGVSILNLVGGGSFSLASIDLDWLNGAGPVTVTFTGDITGGGTANDTFTLDGSNGLETFAFNSGFAAVDEVRWIQDNNFHQFDNIRTGAPVPEPMTMAIAGMALLAGARRRLRKSVA